MRTRGNLKVTFACWPVGFKQHCRLKVELHAVLRFMVSSEGPLGGPCVFLRVCSVLGFLLFRQQSYPECGVFQRPFCSRHFRVTCVLVNPAINPSIDSEKADSTLRSSRAVPHPSTNRALRRLTSEVNPVNSTRYGRQRNQMALKRNHPDIQP